MNVPEHKFTFNLPTHNHEWDTNVHCMNMDQKPLKGAKAVVIKASANGFTNVCVEFEAPAFINFSGALFSSVEDSIKEDYGLNRRLRYIYTTVIDKYFHGDVPNLGPEGEVDFICDIMRGIIDNIK